MVFVYFKRLKSSTTWHRTIQFRLAPSPQNNFGFQSLPNHHYAHQVQAPGGLNLDQMGMCHGCLKFITLFWIGKTQKDTLLWSYRSFLKSIVLYCIVLYCIVLYCIVLYCIVLYCIVLCCVVLCCVVLCCIVLYCIVLYCIVLYCIGDKDHVYASLI